MAGNKRDRQRIGRQERMKAAAAARRKAAMRRRAIFVVAGTALAVVVIVLIASSGGDDTTVATDETTTTALGAVASVAGKPCVAVADPLPAGAPSVPVEVGPPPSQLIKRDLVVGTGAVVPANATVTANYIGVSCSTGKIFDSSYSRNQATTFPLNQVIDGWKDGIPGMMVGGQRLLGIPSQLAYKADGRPPLIAPDEALWFVVEVVEVK